jgi:hypothetical protein
VSAFLARAAAPTADASEKTVQMRDPEAMPSP